MKNAVIRARIDSELKAEASRVLAACGLEPSDAIRMFLQQVVAHQGIPFDIRSAHREPSMAEGTGQAGEEAGEIFGAPREALPHPRYARPLPLKRER
jgi:DNA-damage-inducible protein J